MMGTKVNDKGDGPPGVTTPRVMSPEVNHPKGDGPPGPWDPRVNKVKGDWPKGW